MLSPVSGVGVGKYIKTLVSFLYGAGYRSERSWTRLSVYLVVLYFMQAIFHLLVPVRVHLYSFEFHPLTHSLLLSLHHAMIFDSPRFLHFSFYILQYEENQPTNYFLTIKPICPRKIDTWSRLQKRQSRSFPTCYSTTDRGKFTSKKAYFWHPSLSLPARLCSALLHLHKQKLTTHTQIPKREIIYRDRAQYRTRITSIWN
jgi:hypothetical protein